MPRSHTHTHTEYKRIQSDDQKKWSDVFREMIHNPFIFGSIVLCILVVVIVVLVFRPKNNTTTNGNDGNGCYTIGKSETMTSIATRLGISVADLETSNPSVDPNNMQVGSLLVIPNGICYTAVSGDSCDSIAKKYNMTLDRLEYLNPNVICGDQMKVGQIFLVAIGSTSSPPSGTTYTIKAGDTCNNIIGIYHITLDQLVQANPGLDCSNLQIGQVLNIPSSSSPPVITGIQGYFYGCNGINSRCACVNGAVQSQAPVGNLAAFFVFDENERPSIIQKGMATNPNYWSAYQYSGPASCTYKAYTLGGSALDWNTEADYVDNNLLSAIAGAGYNTIIFDVESMIDQSKFTQITALMKQKNLTVMLYSIQYADQYFTGFAPSSFVNIDYGIPSIYGGAYNGGNCNYDSICNLDWWLTIFGSESKLILGITVGTWPTVQKYPHKNGTVADGGFAGYVEWLYSIGSCDASTSVSCGSNPC